MTGSIAMRGAVAAPRRVMLRVRVPRDLAEVTDIDTAREVDPQEAGIPQARAASLWRAVENLYRTGYYPSIMFCLRRHGQIVFNRALGHARGNGPDADPDSIAAVRARWNTPGCVFSASKAPSAMVLHRMEQDGLIRLLDPVAHYIPEFGAHGKHRTTIYHLLAHRAGVPGIEGVTDPQVVMDHALSLQLICGAQPRHLLGRRQAYHAITAGVIVGEIVRRVTGMDIRQAWRRWFKEPMGFKVFDYGADARVRARIAEQTLTGLQGIGLVDRFTREILGATLPQIIELVEGDGGFYRAIIPAGNMVTTADEIGAFYQMLLDGGSWGGKQILRPETVFRATHEAGPHSFDGTLGIPLRFSPGFMLGGAPFGLFGPRSQEAFGHIGLANNITWADPERRISVAMVVSGIPLVAGNIGALVRLMTAIAAACPREV